jgi:hypothetical protein
MSHHQNTEKGHSIKITNKFFENVSKLKHLGKAVTNQNYIYKDIKSSSYCGGMLVTIQFKIFCHPISY